VSLMNVLGLVSFMLTVLPRHNRTENTAPDNSSTVECVSVAAKTCLPSRCLATDHVILSQYETVIHVKYVCV
jgi:hypothetical protein